MVKYDDERGALACLICGLLVHGFQRSADFHPWHPYHSSGMFMLPSDDTHNGTHVRGISVILLELSSSG